MKSKDMALSAKQVADLKEALAKRDRELAEILAQKQTISSELQTTKQKVRSSLSLICCNMQLLLSLYLYGFQNLFVYCNIFSHSFHSLPSHMSK